MAQVERSTPVTAHAPLTPGAAAVKDKELPSAGAAAVKGKESPSAAVAITAAKSPAAAAPPIVIEIPSSPDPSVGGSAKWGGSSTKNARKRPVSLDLDDEIEMWTPREKRRLDEDCQILSGDPLTAATEVAPSPAAANDEIAVVAERGKVACRDYPHPRSACAKHPFSTTPHERHCDKCFCYVCDIVAPCVSWKGHGEHCHASDRDKKWKALRFMKQKATKTKPSFFHP